jgi:uncharacterized membrane protein
MQATMERTRHVSRVTTPARHNVGRVDRIASAALGAWTLTRLGKRHGLLGTALTATAGALLLTRAATGHSRLYEATGMSSASLGEGAGINVETAVTVMRPREEIYRFWRDLPNLADVLQHVECIQVLPDDESHWVARGPGDRLVEWDAAIINDEPNEYLAWESLPGSDIEHAGSVHFTDAGDKGTEVHLKLRYVPRAMEIGFAAGKVLNKVVQAEIAQDLRRFKHEMETGTDISTEGQTSGRAAMSFVAVDSPDDFQEM